MSAPFTPEQEARLAQIIREAFEHGAAVTDAALARLFGEPVDDVTRWREELRVNNVYSLTPDGVIFSRRMARAASRRATATGDSTI